VGAGVHTGTAYVGAVGSSQSVSDITVFGDLANTTARLASQAEAGEILVTAETCHASGQSLAHCDARQLQLGGRSQPVPVRGSSKFVSVRMRSHGVLHSYGWAC
jgi:adenylate cyclase